MTLFYKPGIKSSLCFTKGSYLSFILELRGQCAHSAYIVRAHVLYIFHILLALNIRADHILCHTLIAITHLS